MTLYLAGDHRAGGGEAEADPEGEGAGREARGGQVRSRMICESLMVVLETIYRR